MSSKRPCSCTISHLPIPNCSCHYQNPKAARPHEAITDTGQSPVYLDSTARHLFLHFLLLYPSGRVSSLRSFAFPLLPRPIVFSTCVPFRFAIDSVRYRFSSGTVAQGEILQPILASDVTVPFEGIVFPLLSAYLRVIVAVNNRRVHRDACTRASGYIGTRKRSIPPPSRRFTRRRVRSRGYFPV